MKEQLKVLIIDDQTLVHIGLRQVIRFFWTDVVFMQEKNVKEVPDIIMLGKTFSSKSAGINKLKRLKSNFPSSKILVFSSQEEKTYAIPYLKAGAQGYLSRNASLQNIITAIETMLKGERLFCSAALKERFFNDIIDGNLTMKKRKLILTKRVCQNSKKKLIIK